MAEEHKEAVNGGVEKRALRLALLVSEQTVVENFIFLKHLLTGLADESVAIALICSESCDVDGFLVPGAEVIRHPAINLPFAGIQNRRILLSKLEKFKPNVLHCLSLSLSDLARRLAKETGLHYLLTINSAQSRFRKFSPSSRHLSKIIVPTKTIADSVAKALPKFAGCIQQINIGAFVEDEPVCFTDLSSAAILVVGGKFDSTAEFETLFEAVKHLVIDGYELMLVLAGQGKRENEIRGLLDGMGLLPFTVFAPKLKDLRSVLQTGDIFIQPRTTKIFDQLLIEAMSLGTAVAACKDGVEDLVIDRETAIVFDPKDQLSIYGSLKRLLDDRQYARKLAAGAQQHLRESHTVSGMIDAILKLYFEIQK